MLQNNAVMWTNFSVVAKLYKIHNFMGYFLFCKPSFLSSGTKFLVVDNFSIFQANKQYNFNSNYNQLDANIFIYLFISKTLCIRPSSGAHTCTFSFRYCQKVLLLFGIAAEMELI